MRIRTLARELALKFLYSVEASDLQALDEFEEFAADQEDAEEAREFARSLIEGALERREALIEHVEGVTEGRGWKRLAMVDRSLLLLGAHEILDRDDIPPEVTINELVEIAKRYSSATSGGFVNGVLDRIKSEAG